LLAGAGVPCARGRWCSVAPAGALLPVTRLPSSPGCMTATKASAGAPAAPTRRLRMAACSRSASPRVAHRGLAWAQRARQRVLATTYWRTLSQGRACPRRQATRLTVHPTKARRDAPSCATRYPRQVCCLWGFLRRFLRWVGDLAGHLCGRASCLRAAASLQRSSRSLDRFPAGKRFHDELLSSLASRAAKGRDAGSHDTSFAEASAALRKLVPRPSSRARGLGFLGSWSRIIAIALLFPRAGAH